MGAIIETKELTHLYSAGTPFEHTALRGVDVPLTVLTVDECAAVLKELLA